MPPLTAAETHQFEQLIQFNLMFQKKGKRIHGTLKETCEKFLWRDGEKTYGAFVAMIDISAMKLLADLYEFDTFQAAAEHKENNGDLLRVVKRSVNNSRSLNYSVGIALPPPYKPRLFESWLGVNEVKQVRRSKERSDSKSNVLLTHITNNLQLVASLLAPLLTPLFASLIAARRSFQIPHFLNTLEKLPRHENILRARPPVRQRGIEWAIHSRRHFPCCLSAHKVRREATVHCIAL